MILSQRTILHTTLLYTEDHIEDYPIYKYHLGTPIAARRSSATVVGAAVLGKAYAVGDMARRIPLRSNWIRRASYILLQRTIILKTNIITAEDYIIEDHIITEEHI